MTSAIEERFWAKVDVRGLDDCWLWTASCTDEGYGKFTIGYTTFLAHRIAYAIAIGPIPPDRPFICHDCDNPPCVNYGHLFPGTASDNSRDMVAKGRNGRTILIGEENGRAKLTNAQVAEIRSIYGPPRGNAGRGRVTQSTLARRYGVRVETVGRIVRGTSRCA